MGHRIRGDDSKGKEQKQAHDLPASELPASITQAGTMMPAMQTIESHKPSIRATGDLDPIFEIVKAGIPHCLDFRLFARSTDHKTKRSPPKAFRRWIRPKGSGRQNFDFRWRRISLGESVQMVVQADSAKNLRKQNRITDSSPARRHPKTMR